MVLSYAMSARTCRKCGKSEGDVHMDKRRAICTPCRIQEREIQMSSTYQNFLGHLYINAKSSIVRGTRTKDHVFTLEPSHLTDLWQSQEGKCAISGVFLTHHKDGSGSKEFNASLDRISNAKGYTPDNIQLVAYRINIMKHALSEDMFYWWVKTINDFSCD